MGVQSDNEPDYSALAARAASGGVRRPDTQKKGAKSAQPPVVQPVQPQRVIQGGAGGIRGITKLPTSPQKASTAWNNANTSSSSIARAAASSIAKSNPQSLKSAQQGPLRSVETASNLKQQARVSEWGMRSSPHALQPSDIPMGTSQSIISSTKGNSSESIQRPDSNANNTPQYPQVPALRPASRQRSSKIKSILKIDQGLTSSSLSNLPLDSTDSPASVYPANGSQGPYGSMSAPTDSGSFYQLAAPSSSLLFPTTLRKEKKSILGIGGKAKHKAAGGDSFNEDKPWKHHQSTAQLNVIGPSEKKRYDGVFVTNKGAYMGRDSRIGTGAYAAFICALAPPPERIHGIVVREIWKRSKLNQDTLARIWGLVITDRLYRWCQMYEEDPPPAENFDDGTLTREEFIVGMWTIDQCLYGRKLPKVISREVWKSVNSDFQVTPAKWKEGREERPKRALFKKVTRI